MIARRENGQLETRGSSESATSLNLAITILTYYLLCGPCCAQVVQSSDAAKTLKEVQKSFGAVMAAAEDEYREGLAKTINSADRIVLFRVEFDLESEEVKESVGGFESFDVDGEFGPSIPRFPIVPYGKLSPILDTVTLTRDAEEFSVALKGIQESLTHVDARTNALSHFPTHAVRVYAGDTLLFQTSYCFLSDSFFVDYGRYSRWHDLERTSLSKVFHKVIPLPSEYKQRLDRFGDGWH